MHIVTLQQTKSGSVVKTTELGIAMRLAMVLATTDKPCKSCTSKGVTSLTFTTRPTKEQVQAAINSELNPEVIDLQEVQVS